MTQKPDDAPVTYGELRRAIKQVLEYGHQLTLFTTTGLSNAITWKGDDEKENAAEAKLHRMAAALEAEYRLDEVKTDEP